MMPMGFGHKGHENQRNRQQAYKKEFDLFHLTPPF